MKIERIPDKLTHRAAYMVRALWDLDRRCFPGDERIKVSDATWFLASDTRGAFFGFGGVLVQGTDAFFVRGGVCLHERGRGVYRRLIRRCEREARDRGATRIWTYVLPWNAPSLNALIRCGWRAFQREGGDEGVVYLGREL